MCSGAATLSGGEPQLVPVQTWECSKWRQRLSHCRPLTCRQPALHEGHLLLPLQQGQGWVVQAVQQLVEHLVHGVVVAYKQ